jgi:hypothetical protein
MNTDEARMNTDIEPARPWGAPFSPSVFICGYLCSSVVSSLSVNLYASVVQGSDTPLEA